MDDMYRTVQVACKMAKRAHNKEKRVHVIFREVGLWRIKPIEEIREIDQQAIFGWTTPSWIHDLHPDMTWDDVRRLLPMGDDCFIRKQFYKEDCYFNPADFGMKLYNKYSQEEIHHCLMFGQFN
jgi:hypothetical protein